jgi:hypothetical protein
MIGRAGVTGIAGRGGIFGAGSTGGSTCPAASADAAVKRAATAPAILILLSVFICLSLEWFCGVTQPKNSLPEYQN